MHILNSFDYLTNIPKTQLYIWVFFIGAWVLPLVIISFSYCSIVRIVKKQEEYYFDENKYNNEKSSMEDQDFNSKRSLRSSLRKPKRSLEKFDQPRMSFKHQKKQTKQKSEVKYSFKYLETNLLISLLYFTYYCDIILYNM